MGEPQKWYCSNCNAETDHLVDGPETSVLAIEIPGNVGRTVWRTHRCQRPGCHQTVRTVQVRYEFFERLQTAFIELPRIKESLESCRSLYRSAGHDESASNQRYQDLVDLISEIAPGLQRLLTEADSRGSGYELDQAAVSVTINTECCPETAGTESRPECSPSR
jgi:hypothetical protein